jgi:molecular chaperone DnaK (HSP70)
LEKRIKKNPIIVEDETLSCDKFLESWGYPKERKREITFSRITTDKDHIKVIHIANPLGNKYKDEVRPLDYKMETIKIGHTIKVQEKEDFREFVEAILAILDSEKKDKEEFLRQLNVQKYVQCLVKSLKSHFGEDTSLFEGLLSKEVVFEIEKMKKSVSATQEWIGSVSTIDNEMIDKIIDIYKRESNSLENTSYFVANFQKVYDSTKGELRKIMGIPKDELL